jgi:DNA-binding transcriptional MerR regulator
MGSTMNHPPHSADHAVYAISVAAELSGLAIQSLRLYERKGLLEPARTTAGTRRYSQSDIRRLRRIAELVGSGVNLAGVEAVLALEQDNAALRRDLATARAEAAASSGGPGAATASYRADRTRQGTAS